MTVLNTVASGDLITSSRANLVKTYMDTVELAKTESKTGADASGNSGGTNRILTLDAVPNSFGFVSVGGMILTETSQFTRSGANITFLNKLYNNSTILVMYFVLL